MGLNRKAKVRFRGPQFIDAKRRFDKQLSIVQIGIPVVAAAAGKGDLAGPRVIGVLGALDQQQRGPAGRVGCQRECYGGLPHRRLDREVP